MAWWCTQWIEGVTIRKDSARSSRGGSRRLEWWNMAESASSVSNTTTLSSGTPSSRITPARTSEDSSTSPKWKRSAELASRNSSR